MYNKKARHILFKTIALHGTCLVSMVMVGCVAYEASSDTHQSREYLTEDLEKQIMFNLIRAKNGLPFAHYDVTLIQAQVTAKITPGASVGQTVTHNGYPRSTQTAVGGTGPSLTSTIGSVSSAAETVVRPYGLSVGGERDNAITVACKPIFDEPKLYAAYVKFLNVDNRAVRAAEKQATDASSNATTTTTTEIAIDPQTKAILPTKLKAETVQPPQPSKSEPINLRINGLGHHIVSVVEVPANAEPPAGAANRSYVTRFAGGQRFFVPATGYVKHTLQYWEGSYYYVPEDYVSEFSDLCIAVVARGVPQNDLTTKSGAPVVAKKGSTQQQLEDLNTNLNNLQNQLR